MQGCRTCGVRGRFGEHICSKAWRGPHQDTIACPMCGQAEGTPPFVCGSCGTGIPKGVTDARTRRKPKPPGSMESTA
jgi:hypothetical protein